MAERICVAAAATVSPAALAVLRDLGFSISHVDAHLLQATKSGCRLLAEDPILLLGLAKLVEQRGAGWRPTDAEVAAAVEFDRRR